MKRSWIWFLKESMKTTEIQEKNPGEEMLGK
jgi:hypothetical protein